MTQNDPIPLFHGSDPRYGALLDAIMDVIIDRQEGLLFVGIVGVLRLVETKLLKDHFS